METYKNKIAALQTELGQVTSLLESKKQMQSENLVKSVEESIASDVANLRKEMEVRKSIIFSWKI